MRKYKIFSVIVGFDLLLLFFALIFFSYKIADIYAGDESLERLNIDELLSKSPIYISSNSKTYSFSNLDEEPVEIAPVAGIMSPDKKEIAYTINSEVYKTRPFLYLYNLDTKEVKVFDVNIEYLFSVSSWSPDSKKIVIIKFAQYVGGMVAYIFDIEEQDIVKSFNVINSDGYWISNDEYIFTDPSHDCPSDEVCDAQISAISLYNYTSNSIRTIVSLSDKLDIIPELRSLSLQNDNIISFSKFIPSEQRFVSVNDQKVYYQIDVYGENIGEYVDSQDSIVTKLKSSLEKNDIAAQIQYLQQNSSDTDWYLVMLESDSYYHEFYVINISESSNIYKLPISGQSVLW